MRRVSRSVCALVVLVVLFGAACSTPPDKEIETAQVAVDAARAAGAEQYAADSYNAANTALRAARDAAAQRDYRLALSRALDAREQAQDAAKQAADGKARARSDSEAAIRAVTTGLQELDQKIETATGAMIAARDLKAARTTAANAGTALQKARAALAEGNYLQARAALGTTRDGITAAIRELDESIAARRPRPARRSGTR